VAIHALDYDLEGVLPFVQRLLPGLVRSEGMRAIGLRKNGELVAGAVFEGFNGRNLWAHIAAVPGARWLNRDFLRACFAYAFGVCGVSRVSGYVDESNRAARRFDEHLGFREEARLRGAGADGGDVIVYVMWRQDCRFLEGLADG
jgi:RimJ/RimL family protein N-acetyltransferase